MSAVSSPPRPTPPDGASPGALVRWTIDVLNAHDAEALRQVYAPTIRARFPTRTVRGADELVSWWRGVFAAVPDLGMTIEGMAENGTRDSGEVFLRWRLAGHHSGAEWEGLEATGAAVDLDGMDHFVVADGRIASNFVIFDQMQFARQIGLLPAEGSRLEVGLRRGFNALARRRRGR
ncbi:ester cyclase [Actinomycetospora succinea]|uniref:ester cyclase n=1 Tax=Actinomycetospora succinea TaxID=663603 RepID=UPI0014150F60|nr:nuclear transport factor 2 family protein [Actinomycetospora succinea]